MIFVDYLHIFIFILWRQSLCCAFAVLNLWSQKLQQSFSQASISIGLLSWPKNPLDETNAPLCNHDHVNSNKLCLGHIEMRKAEAVLSKWLAYFCCVNRGLSFPEQQERFLLISDPTCQQLRKYLAFFVDLFCETWYIKTNKTDNKTEHNTNINFWFNYRITTCSRFPIQLKPWHLSGAFWICRPWLAS